MALPAVEGVLWDLDATIVDTESLLDSSIRTALVQVSAVAAAAAPAAVDEALHKSRGHHDKGPGCWPSLMIEMLQLHDTTEDELHDATYEVFNANLPNAPLMPGAQKALEAVAALHVRDSDKVLPQAIVTSGTRAQTDLKAGFYPHIFKQMTLYVTVDDVHPQAKPKPLPYQLAAAALGVDVRRCIVVEDSVPGCTAGIAAGAFVVAVPLPSHRETVAAIVGDRGIVVESLAHVDWASLKTEPASKPYLATIARPVPHTAIAYLKGLGRTEILEALAEEAPVSSPTAASVSESEGSTVTAATVSA